MTSLLMDLFNKYSVNKRVVLSDDSYDDNYLMIIMMIITMIIINNCSSSTHPVAIYFIIIPCADHSLNSSVLQCQVFFLWVICAIIITSNNII